MTAKYTATTAQIIATLAATGTGWDAIAHELNDKGERTPTGRSWRGANVRRISAEAIVQHEATQAKAPRTVSAQATGRLAVVPELVTYMEGLYWSEMLSHGQIADWLNAEGVPTVTGRGMWGVGTVGRILRRHGVASRPGWGKGAKRAAVAA